MCWERIIYTVCEKDIYSICLLDSRGVKDGTLEIHQRCSGFLLSGYCFIGQRSKNCNCRVWVMHIFCKEIYLIPSCNVTMIALTSDICCGQIFYIFGIICQRSYPLAILWYDDYAFNLKAIEWVKLKRVGGNLKFHTSIKKFLWRRNGLKTTLWNTPKEAIMTYFQSIRSNTQKPVNSLRILE